MSLTDYKTDKILILDGATGTEFQKLGIPDSAWQGYHGCYEILNVSAPELVETVHREYLELGADLIETNTFGILPWVMAEYDLDNRVAEITRASVRAAKNAIRDLNAKEPKFVLGSIGPGTKLASLGQINYDKIYQAYQIIVPAMAEENINGILIETSQDPLMIKAAMISTFDALERLKMDIPVMVSVTIESTGSMLIGTDAETIATIVAPFPVYSLGMNCGLGPKEIHPHVKNLSHVWDRSISVHANAGLPENVGGNTVYKMSPGEFATISGDIAKIPGIRIIGGCCGTSPNHIRALSQKLSETQIIKPVGKPEAGVASLFTVSRLRQEPAPFFVGERANATGSKKFRQILLNEEYDETLAIARQQTRDGAHTLDVSVAYSGRDEKQDMWQVLKRYTQKVQLPLMVDSTNPEVVEDALKMIGGKPIINSANFENGEERFDKICGLAKKYGAPLVCLTIDEKGMGLSVERKLEITARMFERATNMHKIPASDLIFDPLTFSIGSGKAEYEDSAKATLDAIRKIKETFSESQILLGLSNVSFGLSPASRKYLNSVFLHHAIEAGMDMCIVNVKQIIPYYKISETEREICEALLFNNRKNGDPLTRFLNHFKDKKQGEEEVREDFDNLSNEDKVTRLLIDGEKEKLVELLTVLKDEIPAEKLINEYLISGMKVIGEMFGSGEMQLPFVLHSAEVMKASVSYLEPFLPKKESKDKTKILLATVKGDVHDIGKNLVDIILSNNGFETVNLGIKIDIEPLIEAIDKHNPHAIGLSGLLVKSTTVMKENLEVLQARGYKIPVLLGGAALTPNFVSDYCQPVYNSPVYYCKDAFDGLNIMNAIKENTLDQIETKTSNPRQTRTKTTPSSIPFEQIEMPSRNNEIPKPPFFGRKRVEELTPKQVFKRINTKVLFRARWGYKRGKMSKNEYEDMLQKEVLLQFEIWRNRIIEGGYLEPVMLYGYWHARSDQDNLLVLDESGKTVEQFEFPRQKYHPTAASPIIIIPKKDDLLPLTLASTGQKFVDLEQELYKTNNYKDYYLVHGIGSELAEGMAEYLHKRIIRELNIQGGIKDGMPGARYSFGYPACPDLEQNRIIFNLLKPEEFGIQLSDQFQMIPEQTTCAVVALNKAAKYFAIK